MVAVVTMGRVHDPVPKVDHVRRLILLSAAATLLLAGCGGSDGDSSSKSSGDLDSIKVTDGAKPTVSVDKGFSVTTTARKVVKDGAGETVDKGDTVKIAYVAVNGRTGKQFDSSFTTGTPISVSLDETKVLPGFVKGLQGEKVGSRVLVAMSPKDGFGQAQKSMDIRKNDTMVFLFDIVSEVPTKVTGEARATPKTYPKLEVDKDNIPTAFVKKSTTNKKKDAKESSFTVIQGTGPAVAEGQTISVQYFGQIYPGGTTFDESYSKGGVYTQPLANLYKCWGDELVGKKVGSRVIIVCPAAVGQGEGVAPEGSNIKAGDTLLFSVDLLDAY